ncbi:(R)-mandelonitrile lyase [Dankookia sp. P2]|uniref:(R)-mandelonitrile lyase n=1 Tax=Dankookia sp. P2 TaxID=3423955 RepID=UPI003D67BFB4
MRHSPPEWQDGVWSGNAYPSPALLCQHDTGTQPWTSPARAPSPPAAAPPTGSPAPSGSTRCSARLDPARAAGALVTFEPGARTAWHTHPLGQTLVVTAGCGRVQREGGPVEEIRPGDVIWFPPGEKHWHGAAPTTAMSHIAIQERLDGKAVEWLEQVTDAQYGG